MTDDDLDEYRSHLIVAEQKAQEQYDKTILSLSGGALGITFAFANDFVGDGPLSAPGLLLGAWASWGISVTLVLASFFLSNLALRKAIDQVDEGIIRTSRPGGPFDVATAWSNGLGGLLFLVGVTLLCFFVHANLRLIQ